jgi:ribulose-5-phosphate 4-epimerase/fuculose-1-phosphate aldolase
MTISLPRPAPQAFASVDEERRDRKQRLAVAFRLFAEAGFEEGAAGHISARDPEHRDLFWVNPVGVPFAMIKASDLILVNDRGDVVQGERPINPAAFAIHSAIHRARTDVVAAAHSHSVHGRAFATLRQPLAPLTQDACAFYEDHAVYGEYLGPVLGADEGRRIASALGGNKAAILANHGLLTVGTSVDSAVFWYLAMDRCCQAELLARAAGTPVCIGEEAARATQKLAGNEEVGWISYQPLMARIVDRQPDVLA